MKLAFLLLFISQPIFAITLVITDSHGEGAFGTKLVEQLENQNEHVIMHAVGGSTPSDWLEGKEQVWGYWHYETGKKNERSSKPITPKLSTLLSIHNPDRVIIELGTNLIWQEITSREQEDIQAILALLSQAECYWIALPDLRPQLIYLKREIQIRELLKATTSQSACQLIKSWEFTKYPRRGGDGIHYDQIPLQGAELARQWALKAFKVIQTKRLDLY